MDTKVHVEHGDSTAAVPVADPHPNFKQGLREASILAPSPALAMTPAPTSVSALALAPVLAPAPAPVPEVGWDPGSYRGPVPISSSVALLPVEQLPHMELVQPAPAADENDVGQMLRGAGLSGESAISIPVISIPSICGIFMCTPPCGLFDGGGGIHRSVTRYMHAWSTTPPPLSTRSVGIWRI